MKKAKAMTESKDQMQNQNPPASAKADSKKSHVRLVKPAETSRLSEPGVGCRPTGVQ